MAIKVSGTTVVDDSRSLTNIASVDATTVTAIGAAGVGGGGTHDFVASGAIANGDVVVLNSDGTVSVVTSTAQSVGSSTLVGTMLNYATSAYDSLNNKVVTAYKNNSDGYNYAVVGTVSGTSISFGTPVATNITGGDALGIAFDSSNNKIVMAFANGTTFGQSIGTGIVGTVSGTSISFGSATAFTTSNVGEAEVGFDSSNNKVVIAYRDSSNSNYGTAVVGTVSGTSISFGSATVFNSALTSDITVVFDSNSNKTVIGYRDYGNSQYGTAVVGTVSGTSISFGSSVVFNANTTSPVNGTFDSNSNKILFTYRNAGDSYKGTVVVGTVSGTSISFGSGSAFTTGTGADPNIAFDTVANKFVVAYKDVANSSYATAISGTVSGTSVSFGSTTVLQQSSDPNSFTAVYDSANDKVAIVAAYSYNNGVGYVFSNSSTDADTYIGVAAEAISDTATGEITITSGINEGQTGLTIGQSYFVADDGTLTTTNNGRKIGEALSATNLQVKTKLTGGEMNEYLGGLV